MIELDSVSPTINERFWQKVDLRGPHECWNWTSATASGREGRPGYGTLFAGIRIRHGKKVAWSVYAHQYSYELHHGPIPDGLWVLHTCDNTLCVNPAHLYAGTAKDNVWDAIERGHFKLARRSFTDEQVLEIVALAGTMTVRQIAERYGTSSPVISMLLNGQTYRAETTYVERPLVKARKPTTFERSFHKLPDEAAVRFIRKVYKQRDHPEYLTGQQLADKYGCDPSLISRVARGLDGRYACVPMESE